MASASDFVSALSIPGDFNWPKAVRTLLVRMHRPLLLPLTQLAGRRPAASGRGDPLAAVGGSFLINLLCRDALSPLQLYAMSELAHVVTSQAVGRPQGECMRAFVRQANLLESLGAVPDAIVVADALPPVVQGLDPGAPAGRVPDPGGLDWLPGMSFAHVGQPFMTNAFQDKCGEMFALLLNRLGANLLPESWRPDTWKGRQASVQLQPGGPEITTPGGLVAALCALPGVDFFMQIVSRVTGFSQGMAVKQDDQWLQIPFVVPLRTGLTLLEGVADSSGTPDIASLMSHAEVALRVTCPGSFSFRVFFYMGVDGTTAWHAGADPVQPWANSPEVEMQHSAWETPAKFEAAADTAATVACVVNRTADVLGLPGGGYGYLGVCNDSVGFIQAALGEEVTMFPCIVAGHAKHAMTLLYKELHQSCVDAGDSYMAGVVDAARLGLGGMPCDIVHDAATAPDAVRRLRAGLPSVTAFEVLEGCRRDLEVFEEQLRALGGPVYPAEQLPEAEAVMVQI